MTDKKKFFVFIGVIGAVSLFILVFSKFNLHTPKHTVYGRISDTELTEDMINELGLYVETSYKEEIVGIEVNGKEYFSSLTPAECILHLDEKLQSYLDYYLPQHYVGTASIVKGSIEEGDPNAVSFTVHLDDLDENVYCSYLIYKRRFRFKSEKIESGEK